MEGQRGHRSCPNDSRRSPRATDFTYVRTWAEFVYVAFVVDVFAQRIAGWHASTSKKVDMVITPLRIVLWQREREGHSVSPGHLNHHSGARYQYTAIRLTEHLALEGIAASIGTVDGAYDNALMKTINGLFKTESLNPQSSGREPGRFRSRADIVVE